MVLTHAAHDNNKCALETFIYLEALGDYWYPKMSRNAPAIDLVSWTLALVPHTTIFIKMFTSSIESYLTNIV